MQRNVPYKQLEPPRVILAGVFLLVALWYLSWRAGTLNSDALVFSLLLYTAEIYGFGTTLMHLFMTWRLTVRKPPPVPDGWSVDVFVTTINEPVSLLRRTLRSAQAMAYPHQTWLLDDGSRPEMEALAKELGCRYLQRPDNTDAKAGNLNHALQHSEGDFIAVFDADHAPNQNFLVKTLGYFQDSSVAYVQTPQDFYNLDSYQHHQKKNNVLAWHEQSVFFRIIQRGKDYWNAAFFCGSCAVIRRKALDAVGGFATGTVTEDLHTSIKLHKKGFQSVYHAESLAFGLAPFGIVSFLKQRIRWGQGAMQAWRKEGVFFCRGLTWAQRINYLASSITYFDGWQKGFFYLAPVVVLTTGIMPIKALGADFLFHFVPYFFLTFWVFEEVNRGYGRSLIIEQYNMARFASMAWSTLAIFKKNLRFMVTPKDQSSSPGVSWFLAPQLIVMALNFLALPVGVLMFLNFNRLPAGALTICMIWAVINFLLAVNVLWFTRNRLDFKRGEYRFPVPLPAKLTLKNSSGIEVYGVIDDISISGFRFYASIPESVRKGHTLEGQIYLPTGPIPVKAEIKALIQGFSQGEYYVKAIGCRFEKDSQREDRLTQFLFGSDLQRRMNDLQETILTPLDHFSGLAEVARGSARLAHWAPISFTLEGREQSPPEVGLMKVSNESSVPKQMVVFSPIPDQTSMELNLHGRGRVSKLSGKVGASKRSDSSDFSIYRYDLTPERDFPS